jgi:hypothetical protein
MIWHKEQQHLPAYTAGHQELHSLQPCTQGSKFSGGKLGRCRCRCSCSSNHYRTLEHLLQSLFYQGPRATEDEQKGEHPNSLSHSISDLFPIVAAADHCSTNVVPLAWTLGQVGMARRQPTSIWAGCYHDMIVSTYAALTNKRRVSKKKKNKRSISLCFDYFLISKTKDRSFILPKFLAGKHDLTT